MTDEQMLARLRHITGVLGSINALSEERRELILALHGRRYSYRRLARELGLSETRIWQIVHKDELDPRIPGERGKRELFSLFSSSGK